MEYLKGYSAKAGFVLTRGVEWKLPTTATDYTSIPRDGNGQGRVRVKHLPARWHTCLALLYPYPPNVTGKNTYPYPQGTRRVKGYPMGININMSLRSYIRVQ
jgi:hypothetical protein